MGTVSDGNARQGKTSGQASARKEWICQAALGAATDSLGRQEQTQAQAIPSSFELANISFSETFPDIVKVEKASCLMGTHPQKPGTATGAGAAEKPCNRGRHNGRRSKRNEDGRKPRPGNVFERRTLETFFCRKRMRSKLTMDASLGRRHVRRGKKIWLGFIAWR